MNKFKYILLFLIIIGIGVFLYFVQKNKVTDNTVTPPPTEVSSIKGCYVAKLAQDVYTLNIQSEDNGVVSGLLSFNNFEKDSSSGTFSGTYSGDILLGDYSFDSEGMHSDRQVIFRKEGDNFVEGFGDVKTVDNKEMFADVSTVTYDPNSTFVKSTSCPALSIQNTTIKEDNFSGTIPTITGTGLLADQARAYVTNTVADFRKTANAEVPDMQKKFGVGSPPATYTITITAMYVEGAKTDSIVMIDYEYTGGANGNSVYKVITSSHSTGKILSLSDVIKKDQQSAFTELVKNELNNWVPDGSDAPVVFPDEVKSLEFSSFTNWSLDDKNLTIYFDQNEIGPSVLGIVPFPISLDKLKNFMAI